MTTFECELVAQCESMLSIFRTAQVPFVAVPALPHAPDTWIALRPAMRALRVSLVDQRWIERHIREESDRYQVLCVSVEPAGFQVLLVQLQLFLLRFGQQGRHPACARFAVWYAGALSAFMTHGYYDPLTNHTPPAECQLDAIECREEGRDLLNQLLPGFGDVASGHRPTTEEGRRMIGYLVTDADGIEHSLLLDSRVVECEDIVY